MMALGHRYEVETKISFTGKEIRVLYKSALINSECRFAVRPNGLLSNIVERFSVENNLTQATANRLFETNDYDLKEVVLSLKFSELALLSKISEKENVLNLHEMLLVYSNEHNEVQKKMNEYSQKETCQKCKSNYNIVNQKEANVRKK